MPNKKTALSKNEWTLMSALWEADRALALSEIVDAVGDDVQWEYSTFRTQIERLVRAGYIDFEKRGHMRFFSPAISMDECIRQEKHSILGRIAPQAANQLLLCMLRDAHGFTQEETEELTDLVSRLRNDAQGPAE